MRKEYIHLSGNGHFVLKIHLLWKVTNTFEFNKDLKFMYMFLAWVGQFKTRVKRVLKKAQFTQERIEYKFFFCSTSPLKAPNRFKSLLKLAWRFVLTSCDILQNPFTQEKILKFWQCRTK
jgi:hypothetical protein